MLALRLMQGSAGAGRALEAVSHQQAPSDPPRGSAPAPHDGFAIPWGFQLLVLQFGSSLPVTLAVSVALVQH